MLQTLGFNGVRQINTAATFFRYEVAAQAAPMSRSRVRADGADLGLYWPGDAVELPRQCSTWDITPTTASCAGTVRLGVGRVESARLVGNVRVIDQGADKTAGATQFLGSATKPAVAAAWGLVGIKANTKRVAVKRLVIASDIAGTLGLWFATGAPTVNPSTSSWQNKLSGSAVSDCSKVYGESAGNPNGTELPGGVNFLNVQTSANVPAEVPMSTPIVLQPGAVLVVGGWAVNKQVQVVADLEEF